MKRDMSAGSARLVLTMTLSLSAATGVRVMRLGEESRVASFTRTQHDDSESTEEIENVSDEEIQASLNEDASEVIESDTAPDDDNVEDNAENSDVKSDEDTEE